PINTPGLTAIEVLLRDLWMLATAPPPSTSTGAADAEVRRVSHTAIKRITHDLEDFRFNTVLSKLMILRNELKAAQAARNVGADAWREAIRAFLLLAAPVFPHVTEELWTASLRLGYSIHQQSWPQFDE